MGEHLRPTDGDDACAQIRELLQSSGLVLESVGISGALGTDRFEPLMRAAAALGSPCVTTGTGGLADDEAAWGEMMDLVRRALPLCQETGVKLSVKPHVRASVYNAETAARFIAEIDSELVGLNVDNTHLQRSGDDPIAAVDALRPWILTARIRDFRSDDLSIGRTENQIPGKGQADVEGYFRALCRVPGLDFVTVEMVGTKDLVVSEVRRVIGEALTVLRTYPQD